MVRGGHGSSWGFLGLGDAYMLLAYLRLSWGDTGNSNPGGSWGFLGPPGKSWEAGPGFSRELLGAPGRSCDLLGSFGGKGLRLLADQDARFAREVPGGAGASQRAFRIPGDPWGLLEIPGWFLETGSRVSREHLETPGGAWGFLGDLRG